MTKKLRNISDIRRYFHTLDKPIFFVSATNFNLLGMDEWVKNFKFINYIDCYDGRHPNTFVPSEIDHDEFTSIEDINNYLLSHDEVREYFESMGEGGKAVFLMFDEKTEQLAEDSELEVWFPSAALRNKIDDKIETVRIGNKAGVPSVPNALGKVSSYTGLRELSEALGEHLVVQTPYGDSGHTTFFISNEEDYNKHAEEIEESPEVKIMKRIHCRGAAIEACATKKGTIVGPLMTELVGFQEITPYKGGWCGNEIFSSAFNKSIRKQAREYTFRFGEQLREEGYRGYFELDFLIDVNTDELYLGEINPRVTGASSMTNHAAFAHADAPLFLFHLLEFSNIDFDLDIDGLNKRWANAENIDTWSQMVIKHTSDTVDLLDQAPETGIYRMKEDGCIEYSRFDYHRRAVHDEDEAFFLRISNKGDFRYKGADLGIIVMRGRLMNDKFLLKSRAKRWLKGITDMFEGKAIQTVEPLIDPGFKML